MHRLGDAGGQRSAEDALGPRDVDVDHRLTPVLGHADVGHGRGVDDRLHAAAVLDERRLVAQVAFDHLAAESQQLVGAPAVADERPHLVAALAEQTGDLAAQEAGGTGQEDAHRADSTPLPCPRCDVDVIRSCPLPSVRAQERCVMEYRRRAMPFSGAGAVPVVANSSSTRSASCDAVQRVPPFSIAASLVNGR